MSEDDLPPLYEEDEVLDIPTLVDISQIPKNVKLSDFWEPLDSKFQEDDDLPPLLDAEDESMDDLPPLVSEESTTSKKPESKPKPTVKQEEDDLPPLVSDEEEEENHQTKPKSTQSQPQKLAPKNDEDDLPPLVSDEEDEPPKKQEVKKEVLKKVEEDDDLPPLISSDDEDDVPQKKQDVKKETQDYDDLPPLMKDEEDDAEEKKEIKKEQSKKVEEDDEPPPLESDEDDDEEPPGLLNSEESDDEKVKKPPPKTTKSVPQPKPPQPKPTKVPPVFKETKKTVPVPVKVEKTKKQHQPKKKKEDNTKKMAKIIDDNPVVKKEEVKVEKILKVIGHCKIKTNCTKTSDEIKEEEEYFKVKCNQNCFLEFHKPCWLKYQREHKDSKFLNCPTPDCEGFVERAERYYKDPDSEKMTSSIQEFSVPIEEKEDKKKTKKEIKKETKEVKVKETKKKETPKEIPKEVPKEVKQPEIKQPEVKVKVESYSDSIKSPRDIKVTPVGENNLDMDKILQDLKKKKEMESEKWASKPKPEVKKQNIKGGILNTKGLQEILKISKENQKYSGGIEAETKKKEEIIEKEEKDEKEDLTFWDEGEDEDIFFYGEIIFLNYNPPEKEGKTPYGLLRDNIQGEVLNFTLDNEGNQTGKRLELGDRVKFIRQENTSNCIILEKDLKSF